MDLLNNIQSTITTAGLVILTISFAIIGIVITVRMTGKNPQGFREAFTSLGGAMIGVIVFGAAGGLVSAGVAIAGLIG